MYFLPFPLLCFEFGSGFYSLHEFDFHLSNLDSLLLYDFFQPDLPFFLHSLPDGLEYLHLVFEESLPLILVSDQLRVVQRDFDVVCLLADIVDLQIITADQIELLNHLVHILFPLFEKQPKVELPVIGTLPLFSVVMQEHIQGEQDSFKTG